MMEKIVSVVKGGMVRDVYGPCPHKFDVIEAAEERLQTVEQFLCKIY